MKSRLNSCGTIHGRVITEKVTLTATATGHANASQPRTNEAGLLLKVALEWPNAPNELELLIQLPRQLYISRTDGDHLTAPTIHQYAIVPKTLSQVSTDAQLAWHNGLITRSLYGIYYGLTSATEPTAYFLAKGNMVRFTWSYPVFRAPLVIASTALMMTYYNASTWHVIVWMPLGSGRIRYRYLSGCATFWRSIR